ncbi:MAG: hypothetical protein Q4F66_07940 [Clostridium sp.]|nr:hypothetical protein [Clostridium sp.]
MMKVSISKGIIKFKKNSILYPNKKVLEKIDIIKKLIFKYVLNIMKKIEFELIRNDGVYVKVTEEQKEIIKKLAKCQKKSSSDFIKWIIFQKYVDDFIK